ncbi:MAG: type II toxin-antitoxin system VapC family toxin [Acidobacteria bacterium]|nr:type II toxin-antitoxin system VapC family toxin [Acidobacteriota bacterium]
MILLDTNIVAELSRPRPDPAVERWATTVKPPFGFSVVSVEEVRHGLSWQPTQRLETWFSEFMEVYCEALPVTEAVARRAGDLRGRFQATGETRTQADMLIAATALEHQLPLATRNTRDFRGCGVALVNPFTATLV